MLPIIGANAAASVIARGDAYDMVVKLNNLGIGAPGTGTVLNTQTDILTAAHVVDAPTSHFASTKVTFELVRFDPKFPGVPDKVDIEIEIPANVMQGKTFQFVPGGAGYQVPANSPVWDPTKEGNDIAILRLVDPVNKQPNRRLVAPKGAGPTGFAPFTGTDAQYLGATFLEFGYGLDGTGNEGNNGDEVHQITLTKIPGPNANPEAFKLSIDFGQGVKVTEAISTKNLTAQTIAKALAALEGIQAPAMAKDNVAVAEILPAKGDARTFNIRFVHSLGSQPIPLLQHEIVQGGGGQFAVGINSLWPGSATSGGVKRWGMNTIDKFYNDDKSRLVFDFDNGQKEHDALGEHKGLGGREGFGFKGDSGGPLLVTFDDKTYLIAGVLYGGKSDPKDIRNYVDSKGRPIADGSFGEIGVATRVSSFVENFINPVTGGTFDLVFDMSKQVLGVDKSSEKLTISAEKDANNKLVLRVAGTNDPTYTGVYYSHPIANITSLTIRGAKGDEYTVEIKKDIGIKYETSNAQLKEVGRLDLQGGSVEVADAFSIPNFTIDSGLLNGDNTLDITSWGEWTGGTMSGTGNTHIDAGATFSITGSEDKTLTDRTLENAGSLTWDAGTILGDTGTIHNLTSGSFFAQGEFNGNLANDGLLYPGTAGGAGTLTVNGDYTELGTLNFDLGSSGSDLVAVSGTVTLGGYLNLAAHSGFTATAGDTFTVIENLGQGSINGTFIRGLDGNGNPIPLNEGDIVTTADGAWSFSISYLGGSSGHDVVLTVLPNVTLTSSWNPALVNQNVTFTAIVSGTATTPTGSITFLDNGTAFATVTLDSNAAATYTLSTLTLGTHSITAVYSGDANNANSVSTPFAQVILAADGSLTNLTADVNPSAFGDTVTFTAHVVTATGTPTGTVAFVEGTTTLATETLDSSGTATFVLSSLSVGGHTITAVYSGDSNFDSSSGEMSQTVNRAATQTSVVSDYATGSVVGEEVTFTATVSSAGGTPTGTVTFVNGTFELGTATLDGSGTASLSTYALWAGNNSILAIFEGNSSFLGSSSAVLTQVVSQATTTTTVASSSNPSLFGQAVAFTATVTSAGGAPTGSVFFYDGTLDEEHLLATATVDSNGQATTVFAISTLSVGTHTILAVYSGDDNFEESDGDVEQTVNLPAEVSGVVWLDQDEDGLRDSGEMLLANRTVQLLNDNDDVIATTTTDDTGAYEFEDVVPGAYSITVLAPDGVFTLLQVGSDPTLDSDVDPATGLAEFTASSGATIENLDVGLVISAGTVSGRAWLDVNGDGVQNLYEYGLDGITVELLDSNNDVIDTATTSDGGLYFFAADPEETFSVRFVAPSDWHFTGQEQGSDPAFDSDVDSTGTTDPFTFDSNTPLVVRDAGLYQTAAVNGVVWEDQNGDGVRQENETLLSGLTINLLDAQENVVDTTTTDEDGAYNFDGLVPGAYSVTVIASGYTFTLRHASYDPTLDSDVDPQTEQSDFIATSGSTTSYLDAGLYQMASVSGVVWEDEDGDGVRETGEALLSGLTVNLLDANEEIIATTTTDANGAYSFDNFAPGEYYIAIGAASYTFTLQNAGSDPTLDSDVDPDTELAIFAATSGSTTTHLDAGVYIPAAVSGRVWRDDDADGIQDSGEPGLANVLVSLYDAADTFIGSTYTDSNGNYTLSQLPPGQYYLAFTNPALGFSPEGEGSDPALDSDVDLDGNTALFTLLSNDPLHVFDAGVIPIPPE